ncbi:iron transporter [Arachnia propionica]|uniref:Iron transporter n=1 Tax=Arachnia propionica TaxID=1750 RepID=A0A3P1T8K5_9ACTN|nr:iron transporter [Arachnia propionica]
MTRRRTQAVAWLTVPILALGACSAPAKTGEATNSQGAGASETTAGVTVTNCEQELTLPGPAKKLYVNDGNIIALALAAGAADEITAVSSIGRDLPILTAKYGEPTVSKLKEVAPEYPTLESVLAATPDLMVAGWNYGFSEGKNLTPDILSEKGIPSYILTESCRQAEGGTERGIVDPWEAVRIDITNLGALTGHEDEAKAVVEDMDARLKVLDAAPKPEKAPVVFLFDSARDAVFTSGSFGAPQAIITTAGGTNATADVEDTWVEVSWEKLANANPDLIAFVEYPGQTYEEKVETLKAHPAAKDLTAVKEERFLNLPYAMWTESPINIDAAEYVRKTFEKHGLAPASEVTTKLPMPAEVPGQDKLP